MDAKQQCGPGSGGQAPAPGRITALEPQERHPQRVNVWIDGRFALACEGVLLAGLRVGDELDAAAIERLLEADACERAFERAVHFLAARPRSEAEVRARLVRAGFDAPAVEAAVERLRRAGYLDDEAFARYWVEQRQQFRPRGQRALAHELRQKRVDREHITSALKQVGGGEEEAAYRAAAQRASRLRADDRRQFEQRLGAYLQRRGFSYEVARAAVDRCWRERAGPGAAGWDEEPPETAGE